QTEIATQASRGVQYWPVFLLTSGEHVGCCGLRPFEQYDTVYELGAHLRPAYWGQSYATEACRAVMGFAFVALRATALFAGHHPENDASHQLLKKLGFRHTHDQFYPPTGLRHPSYLLTAEEYAEGAG